jgi:hypothetical protein
MSEKMRAPCTLVGLVGSDNEAGVEGKDRNGKKRRVVI